MDTKDKILDEVDRLKTLLTVDEIGCAIVDAPDSLMAAILVAYRDGDAAEIGWVLLKYLDAGIERAAEENVAKQEDRDREDAEAERGMARRFYRDAA